MGITDFVLIVLIILFGLKGAYKGLVAELFSIFGLVLGYLLAYVFYRPLSNMLVDVGVRESYADPLGFIGSFLAVYIAVMLIGIMLRKVFRRVEFGWADKTGGFLIGGLKAGIILGLIIGLLAVMLPPDTALARDIQRSKVGNGLRTFAPAVFKTIEKIPNIAPGN